MIWRIFRCKLRRYARIPSPILPAMERRDFLLDLSRYAALCAVVPNVWRVTARPRLADDPFMLGVASGDPTPTGGVLWTRLAPRPLEPDGGMDGQRVVVTWELADDDVLHEDRASRDAPPPRRSSATRFTWTSTASRPIAGTSTGSPPRARRARSADFARARPRARRRRCASPSPRASTTSKGCSRPTQHMAREELDLVAHLGDYIYEYGAIPGRVRSHNSFEIRTLDDYRRRYALYKSDPALQAAHARCPWVVTWDDHEVDNNYAGFDRRERHGVRGADARPPRDRLSGVVGEPAGACASREVLELI